MGKFSSHNEYFYNEKEVPSVTTVLKILAKPALVKWANIMGFKRKWVDDILEEKSEIGTRVHYIIEAYIKNRYLVWVDGKAIDKPLIKLYLDQFLRWYNKHDVEMIFMEESMTCEYYGGTIDFYGVIDGKKTVLDFKTSKDIYSSMFLQLSAYVYMIEKQGLEVDQVAILAVNSNKFKYKVLPREQLDRYIETFILLSKTFNLWYSINEEDGWGDILGK